MAEITIREGSFDPRVLFDGKFAEVFQPFRPSIPQKEGIHLVINSIHNMPDSPRATTARYLLGLGVAKVVAESGMTPDAWANTRLEKNDRLSVYGRMPDNPDAWRKPVVTHERSTRSIGRTLSSKKNERFAILFRRYLPAWESLAKTMQLFPEELPVLKDAFADIGHAYKLFEGTRHDIVLIKEPHLDGYHFVVSPKKGFARQWQADPDLLQVSVEGWGIAQGIRRLYGNRGEIHNSGNWADQLKLREESPEGRISFSNLQKHTKQEKRRHRPGIAKPEDAIDTHTHTHVYIPRNGDVVVLPLMKKEEALRGLAAAPFGSPQWRLFHSVNAYWDGIPKATSNDVLLAQATLGDGRLSGWLASHLRGPLIQ